MNQEDKRQVAWRNDQEAAAHMIERLGVYAFVRTAFSSERSLMSWIRTSVSLYTFGFSLIKFIDYMEEHGGSERIWTGPRGLGLALIGLGMLVLVLGALEHLRRLRKMGRLGLPTVSRFPLPVAVAVALLAIGVTTVISMVLS